MFFLGHSVCDVSSECWGCALTAYMLLKWVKSDDSWMDLHVCLSWTQELSKLSSTDGGLYRTMDLLKINDGAGAISADKEWSWRAGISSGPEAFRGFRSCRGFSTPTDYVIERSHSTYNPLDVTPFNFCTHHHASKETERYTNATTVIMTNKLLLFSVVCACNLVLPTYYEAKCSRRSQQVDCKCSEIVLSHYPRKMICAVFDTWLHRLTDNFFYI